MMTEPLQVNMYSTHCSRIIRSTRAVSLGDLECLLFKATTGMGMRSSSYGIAISRFASEGTKNLAPSLMYHLLAPHTLTWAPEDINLTAAQNHSKDTEHKSQTLLKSAQV